MKVNFNIKNVPGMRHYIAIFSFPEYEEKIIEPYYILAKSYEDAMNKTGDMFFSSPSKLEAFIELVVDSNKKEENKQDSNEKLCPFSFENGKMATCQKNKCMAFRHIIDGSGEYVAEYCKLIDRKEK